MKLRNKKSGSPCSSSAFNPHGCGEIVVYYPAGPLWQYAQRLPRRTYNAIYWHSPSWFRRLIASPDCTSDYISEYDVQIAGEWKDLQQAFRDHDLILDDYSRFFFEPATEEDRVRGWA